MPFGFTFGVCGFGVRGGGGGGGSLLHLVHINAKVVLLIFGFQCSFSTQTIKPGKPHFETLKFSVHRLQRVCMYVVQSFEE